MGERHAIARTRYIGRLAEAEGQAGEMRKQASETGKLSVLGALGAGPTPTGATTGATPSGTPAPSPLTAPTIGGAAPDTTGILKEEVVNKGVGRYQPDITKKILDPEAYSKFIQGTAQFRIADALTRDAEALATRSGPLWDELLNLTQLPIIEGAGALARENAETLRREMGKGGAARRGAFATIQQMRERERINSTKVAQLSQARTQLMTYGHQFASQNLSMMEQWTSNLPFQQAYNDMMDRTSELFLEGALPIMAKQTDKENAMKQAMRNEKSGKLGRIITGVAGAVITAAGAFTMNPALLATGVGMTAGALTGGGSNVGFVGGNIEAGKTANLAGGGGAQAPTATSLAEQASQFSGQELEDLKKFGSAAFGKGQSLINKVFGTQFGLGEYPGSLSKKAETAPESLLWNVGG